MGITKLLHGRKKPGPLFCLINLLLLHISCRQADNFPESYTITLSNGYFEVLESVEIGGQKIENIATGEDRIFENFSRGVYMIVVITCSQLKLEAPVSLAGLNSSVRIIIENTGKILLVD